jgi:hypothetical protein
MTPKPPVGEINPIAEEAVKIADQHLAGESIERRKALATDIAEAIVRHASGIAKQWGKEAYKAYQ